MSVRDRIVEFRRVPASSLRPHPRNWRTHPKPQRAALQALLTEVGYAAALLVRTLEDGELEIIDGHLRAELTPEQLVPVLVLDVDGADAKKLLAAFDCITGKAAANQQRLGMLLDEIEWQSCELAALASELLDTTPPSNEAAERNASELPPVYQLVVDCEDEAAQQALYERLNEEGYRCRVVTM